MKTKKLTIAIAIMAMTFIGTSCGNKQQKSASEATTEQSASSALEIDSLLANAESIIGHTLNSYTSKYDSLVTSLQECYDVVRNNRAELEVPDKSSRGLEAEFGGEAGQTEQGQME